MKSVLTRVTVRVERLCCAVPLEHSQALLAGLHRRDYDIAYAPELAAARHDDWQVVYGTSATAAQAPRVAELRTDSLARTLLARLDAQSRALARAVAILGDDVPVAMAAELAGLTPDAAEPSADTGCW